MELVQGEYTEDPGRVIACAGYVHRTLYGVMTLYKVSNQDPAKVLTLCKVPLQPPARVLTLGRV